jgi:anti-sigma regulatory factor (Ser/Thr protein kinase)
MGISPRVEWRDQSISLPADPASAAEARRFVRAVIEDTPHRRLQDAALLCVSELVANVSRHTGASECRLTVRVGEDDLTIEVSDDFPGSPAIPPAAADSEQGRGLRIVDALAGEWGVRRYAPGGKAVWLRLSS